MENKNLICLAEKKFLFKSKLFASIFTEFVNTITILFSSQNSFSFFKSAEISLRINVPGLEHGKMYKRYTFGASCPSLGTRFGNFKREIK